VNPDLLTVLIFCGFVGIVFAADKAKRLVDNRLRRVARAEIAQRGRRL
jgi:hypothetical protein